MISLFLAHAAFGAEMIIGPALIIDGDTIEIKGQRIDLHGIDAPEKEQTCRSHQGLRWPCGEYAVAVLAEKIGTQKVECLVKERQPSKDIVAKCYQEDGNLGLWLLKQGWAVARDQSADHYAPAQHEAKVHRKNLWSGEFVLPGEWLTGKRLPEQSAGQGPESSRELTTSEAIRRVESLACTAGGSVGKCMAAKLAAPAAEDLGWSILLHEEGGYIIERKLRASDLISVYRWRVKEDASAQPMNESALAISGPLEDPELAGNRPEKIDRPLISEHP